MKLFRTAVLLAFALFASSAYSASKTVLVLGDSLSAEYGLARGSGWVALLEKKLQAEKIDARIVNASISGETTSGGRARLPALLDQHKPDVVVIELGGNDALRGLALNSTEDNLAAMITASQKVKARVLLIGMQIPPNYGRDYAQKFAAIYARLAKEKKTDLVPFLLEVVAEQPQLFQGDRIHPTAEAQPLILNNVWPHLKPMLSK
ncbi:MAG TPA: arylesterase [Noviherbaspirillum sp.]|uniref:arylesterase n=1 Tax=Noviherbaspirillum sp. TaxID=1926288 RepID=UPI002DDD9DF0|nr:arylesterase [Noviherbaspirillum sp.]HEV2609264.1 arylesterase [Noviherbaspirillum sp.]